MVFTSSLILGFVSLQQQQLELARTKGNSWGLWPLQVNMAAWAESSCRDAEAVPSPLGICPFWESCCLVLPPPFILQEQIYKQPFLQSLLPPPFTGFPEVAVTECTEMQVQHQQALHGELD